MFFVPPQGPWPYWFSQLMSWTSSDQPTRSVPSPAGSRPVVPSRLVCPTCEVLTTDDANVRCWVCDGELISAHGYVNPTSSFKSPMLAAIADDPILQT